MRCPIRHDDERVGLHESACRTIPNVSCIARWSVLRACCIQVRAGHGDVEQQPHAAHRVESRNMRRPSLYATGWNIRACLVPATPAHAAMRDSFAAMTASRLLSVLGVPLGFIPGLGFPGIRSHILDPAVCEGQEAFDVSAGQLVQGNVGPLVD
jgi:hypothetical protein